MIIHNVVQGSQEWLAARLGIPTASEFGRIITPTGKASAQADEYANKLLAEYLTGKPMADIEGNLFSGSMWMDRGRDLEAQAALSYASLHRRQDIADGGFCTDDHHKYGASPDRLIGDDGLLEIKCPAPNTHVGHMLDGGIDKKYYPQLQGQLFVTGRKWVDSFSYHPCMMPVTTRVERDEEYIAKLEEYLNAFCLDLKLKKAKLEKLGYRKIPSNEGLAKQPA